MPSDGKRERAVGPEFQTALDASGFVGTWENDLRADVVHLSGPLTSLLGIAPESAEKGVPLSALLNGIHWDDQERISKIVGNAHETVGRFEARFRTVRADGAIHWVSARGQVEADDEGRGVRCLGVAVDVTEAYIGVENANPKIDAIERVVDALINLRELLSIDDNNIIKHLIDMLLLELGRDLHKTLHQRQTSQMH